MFEDKTFPPVADFGFIKDVAKALANSPTKNLFRHATGRELTNPQIDESVRQTMS
jgi:hypothetical protein